MLVAAVIAVGFVSLGLWQLDRLDERRVRNATVEARRSEPIVSLDALGDVSNDPSSFADRPVTIEGRYRPDLEFFAVGRTVGDVTGTLVATPLERSDGSLVVVIRGLVPADTEGPPAVGFEPPPGDVVVTGTLDDGEEALRLGEPDPPDGVLRSISRIDLAFVDRWIEGQVLPVSVTLESQEPPQAVGATPIPVEPDELTEGRHLGYAVQWFAFAVVAVVGVGALIWRAGRSVPTDEATIHDSERPNVRS